MVSKPHRENCWAAPHWRAEHRKAVPWPSALYIELIINTQTFSTARKANIAHSWKQGVLILDAPADHVMSSLDSSHFWSWMQTKLKLILQKRLHNANEDIMDWIVFLFVFQLTCRSKHAQMFGTRCPKAVTPFKLCELFNQARMQAVKRG